MIDSALPKVGSARAVLGSEITATAKVAVMKSPASAKCNRCKARPGTDLVADVLDGMCARSRGLVLSSFIAYHFIKANVKRGLMDLTPDIQLPLMELNQCTKQRAVAVLSDAGIMSLDALGGAFWADILFVTGYKRTSLDASQLGALDKASTGLGYGAAQYALLSMTAGEYTIDATQLKAYVRALSVDTVVLLEKELAQGLQGFIHSLKEEHPYMQIVVVTDFFASLVAGDNQQAKKQQAWKELQTARRQPAMT